MGGNNSSLILLHPCSISRIVNSPEIHLLDLVLFRGHSLFALCFTFIENWKRKERSPELSASDKVFGAGSGVGR
ncbi:hypothetical protein TSUD_195050 [Trifolium subterraneum]|nr:hypothetical protein TSUD_195050 [Trifolium subterraneum]